MMKLKLLFTLLLALIGLTIKAQDYNPIITGNTSLFLSSETVEALHVDSVRTDPKGLAHYFHKAYDIENPFPQDNCYHFIPIWSGSKTIASGNTYYFFNKDNDTITITPLNEINVPWIFYKYSNGDYAEAKAISKDFLSLLDFTDSVKTFSLQRKTATNVNVTDPINSVQFQISKHYGIIKMLSFSRLPDSYPVYTLIGTSNPESGKQLLTARSIYNFDINDEFHYKTEYLPLPNDGYVDKTIHKIINKYTSANTDTVIYTIQEFKERVNYTFQSSSYNYITSAPHYMVRTFDTTYILSDTVIYPGIIPQSENIFNTFVDYSHALSTNDRLTMTIGHNSGFFDMGYPNCWGQVTDSPANYITYKEGCGYSEINRDVPIFYSDNSKLVYYKKGNETSGQPLVLSTLTKKSTQALTLYPNPLQQGNPLHYNISNFNVTQAIVYNVTGDKILELNNKEADLQSLDLSSLRAGLYLIQLINESNEYVTNQLIVK